MHLVPSEREVFGCLFLDNQHRLIAFEVLFQGSIDTAKIHPREVVKQALQLNAAAVIAAHNHPSGEATPSKADKAITLTLQQALATVGIHLLDHLILGSNAMVRSNTKALSGLFFFASLNACSYRFILVFFFIIVYILIPFFRMR